jgi:AhpD family alkylhydroperoxidase
MRVDYYKEFPAGAEAMVGLERAVRSGGLEPGLLELVKIRASQINGCTYCLAMHNRDARARGEHQTRLDTVAAVGLCADVLSLDGLDLPAGAGQQRGKCGAAR